MSKGHTILIDRGLQVQGMVTKDDVFHLDAYEGANYTAINWLWQSNPEAHGTAPGFPWARWVGDENQMPSAGEAPYLDQLIALQLGDEWHLNDPTVRDRAVNWFNAIRNQWPDTILYMNNFGGQVNDAALGDFITRARPDMLSFDTYPFKGDYVTQQPNAPAYGSPTNWYGDLRRYRVFALNAEVPLAVYRQTFHAVQDYDQTVYRDPSPSEMNLNTFGALAFGATTFFDFTYNTGASSLFTSPGGDSNPTPAYAQQAEINRRARNLGKTLVHLTGLDSHPNGGLPTMDIMFHRGKTGPNTTDVTPLPIGFAPDGGAPNTFSEWVADRNDPHMRGWAVTNLGTRNGGLRGDVIISWFKPLDSSADNPNDVDDQLYFMVTNAFTGTDGAAADYRQRITVNFLAAVGPTIQYLDSGTGEVGLLNLPFAPTTQTRRQLIIELDGGEGMLFKFNTGDPFIGIEPSADFDLDGDVDGADFLRWQRGVGAAGAIHDQGDANADGAIDSLDLDIWKSQLTAVQATASTIAGVPEPAATTLWALAAVALRGTRSRTAC
ncbi:MAG: hypothetical protein H0T51_04665 [Pirellulales bacterium]|nr:hypothetical protein [Pirellulales bacterium]